MDRVFDVEHTADLAADAFAILDAYAFRLVDIHSQQSAAALGLVFNTPEVTTQSSHHGIEQICQTLLDRRHKYTAAQTKNGPIAHSILNRGARFAPDFAIRTCPVTCAPDSKKPLRGAPYPTNG